MTYKHSQATVYLLQLCWAQFSGTVGLLACALASPSLLPAPWRVPCRLARPLVLFCSLLVLLLVEPVAGRLPPEPLKRSTVMAAVAFAAERYNERSNRAYYYKELHVVEAQPQVVSENFYLTLELVNTLREKKGGGRLTQKEVQNCAVPPEDQQQKQICEFKIWFGPSMDKLQLSSMSCEAATS